VKRALGVLALVLASACGTAIRQQAHEGRVVTTIVEHSAFNAYRFEDERGVTCYVVHGYQSAGLWCERR
jgi:hypothetical protein